MAKRLTAILLLALTLLGSVSCASDEGTQQSADTTGTAIDTAADTEAEETRVTPDIPMEGVDYEGQEFKFIHWFVNGWDHRRNKDIYAEAENGDVINDAVLKRNRIVEERYDVKITLMEEAHDAIQTTIKNQVRMGEHNYDVSYLRMTDIGAMLADGNFLDLNLLEHVDFSKPWWDQRSVEDISINNKLYLVATDINVIDKDATAAMAFNKQMADDLQLPNLYEAVHNDKWTMDYLMENFKTASQDVNGDQKMDENDIWAFLGKNDVLMSFFEGAGGRFCTKDDEDLPVLSFESEKNYAIVEKIFEIIFDEDNFINQHATPALNEDSVFEQLFPNGHGLFYWMRLDLVTQMRSTETDFGILPIPKYDEAQENYESYVSIHTGGLLSVPTTAATDPANLERIGLILEALAAESKYTVMPAYYETALKTKGARDDESEAMLDLIFANRTFDIGDIFGFGGMAGAFQNLAKSGQTEIASFYAKQEKSAQKALDKFVDKVLSE